MTLEDRSEHPGVDHIGGWICTFRQWRAASLGTKTYASTSSWSEEEKHELDNR